MNFFPKESLAEVFEYLCENASDAIYILDTHGNLVAVNRKAEEITGFKREDFLGKSFRKIISPKDLPKALKGFLDVVKGRSIRLEMELKTATGKIVPVELTSTPLVAKGKIVGTFGIVRDISERLLIEKRLRAMNRRLETVLETAMEGITIVDPEENFTFVNCAFAEMLGYRENELLGMNIRKLVDEETFKELKKQTELRKKGKSTPYELFLRGRDGERRHLQVSAAPLWDDDGNFAGSIGIALDITERKKAEEALRESEEKFRNIFEGANDAIVYGDLTGRVLGLNRKAEEVAGVKREEIVGKHFWKLGIVGLKDVPMLLNRLKNRITDNPTSGFEMTVTSRDGKKRFLEVSVATLRRRQLPVGFMAIIRDATERKQMISQLEEYSQRLEVLVEKRTRQLKEAQEQFLKAERLAAIGQVAAMVSHDLRNPLTGIAGAVYYLKMKLDSKIDEKSKAMLELIEKNIEHSNTIINDLLDYSREIRLELKETNPKLILEEALSVVKVPDNIKLTDETQNQPAIRVDVEKIKRVFANIIKNAVDAMPTGGKLTIKSRRESSDLEITLTDTGTGMTKEMMEKIWTPFFTTKSKGLGLGLPICKRIIEAHGGNISVESRVGKGTTFTVTIPLEPPQSKMKGGEKV